jgi:hypothetical protein
LVQFIEEKEGAVMKTNLGQTVSYQVSQTPALDDISPRWGAVSGNTQITFSGKNFNSGNPADYSITIDNVDCPIDEVISPTAIKCTTAARIGEWKQPPKLEIYANGVGSVAL